MQEAYAETWTEPLTKILQKKYPETPSDRPTDKGINPRKSAKTIPNKAP